MTDQDSTSPDDASSDNRTADRSATADPSTSADRTAPTDPRTSADLASPLAEGVEPESGVVDVGGDLADLGDAHTRRRFLGALGAGAGATALGLGNATVAADHAEREMPEEFSERGIPTPRLHREGNLIKDPDGNTVKLRGVNVCDPARAEALMWRSPLWQQIAHATDPERDWYARIVRIPCQPQDIVNVNASDGSIAGDPGQEPEPGAFSREQLQAYVDNYLRPAVEFCARMGVYAIVDYHRHDDQSIQYTQDDVHEELMLFWDVVAAEFGDEPHVLYEVYNEPIEPYAGSGQSEDASVFDDVAEETWLTWREAAQPWVDKIREYAPENIIVIGSPRWTQWTWWAPKHEFEGENLAYAAHIYTHENLSLERHVEEPAQEVPVFVSEFGWDHGTNASFLNGTAEEQGPRFRNSLESMDSLHWQAWCFDPFWKPVMFDFDDSNHNWELVGAPQQGEFMRQWLKETRDDMVPGTSGDDPQDPQEPPEPGACSGIDNATVNDRTVCDPDGDGLFEDFNADGNATHADVQEFFSVQHRPDWKQADRFDFNENEVVGHGDVIALFEDVAKVDL